MHHAGDALAQPSSLSNRPGLREGCLSKTLKVCPLNTPPKQHGRAGYWQRTQWSCPASMRAGDLRNGVVMLGWSRLFLRNQQLLFVADDVPTQAKLLLSTPPICVRTIAPGRPDPFPCRADSHAIKSTLVTLAGNAKEKLAIARGRVSR